MRIEYIPGHVLINRLLWACTVMMMSELHVAVEANVVGVMSNTTAADILSSVRMPSLPPAIPPSCRRLASFIFTMKKEGRRACDSVSVCLLGLFRRVIFGKTSARQSSSGWSQGMFPTQATWVPKTTLCYDIW